MCRDDYLDLELAETLNVCGNDDDMARIRAGWRELIKRACKESLLVKA